MWALQIVGSTGPDIESLRCFCATAFEAVKTKICSILLFNMSISSGVWGLLVFERKISVIGNLASR